jgi:hypothetical protein
MDNWEGLGEAMALARDDAKKAIGLVQILLVKVQSMEEAITDLNRRLKVLEEPCQ